MNTPKLRGLSLIEVLVVVAIISVLIGLLMSATSSLTTQARYARWVAYSKSLRTDEKLMVYYTFSELENGVLPNMSTGYEIDDYDASQADATPVAFPAGQPTLVQGRFPNTQKGGILFDGSGYFDLGSSNYINNAGKHLTVLAWVQQVSFGTEWHETIVLAQNSTGGWGGYCLLTGNSGGQVTIAQGKVANDHVETGPAFQTGEWTQIGFTLDGTTCRFYCNGEMISAIPYATVMNTGLTYTMGRRNYGGFNNPFYGIIDELAVWDRVLDESEIATFYKNGAP